MNPMLSSALGAIFRWAFTFLAGWFVQHNIWTGNEAEAYIGGAALAAVTLVWSLYNKYHGRIKFLTALTMPKGTTEDEVNAQMADPKKATPSVTTPKDQAP